MREVLADFSRFLVMGKTRKMIGPHGTTKGSFADQRKSLLAMFDDSDAPRESSWRETFGYERRPAKPKPGQPFIARGLP